jgi:hypothetical protein
MATGSHRRQSLSRAGPDEASPATTCCPVLNFLASTTNAERSLAAHPDVQGTVISMPEAVVAGRAVFGDILKEA